jgi:hypothetical protein
VLRRSSRSLRQFLCRSRRGRQLIAVLASLGALSLVQSLLIDRKPALGVWLLAFRAALCASGTQVARPSAAFDALEREHLTIVEE